MDGVYVRPHSTKVQAKEKRENTHAKGGGKQSGKGTAQKPLTLVGGGVLGWSGAANTQHTSSIHPKSDDDDTDGDRKPSKIHASTTRRTWQNPKATAVFVPGGDVPAELNGVALAPWRDHPRATASIDGTITSTGDQVAGGISQMGHRHGGVQSGSAETNPPSA